MFVADLVSLLDRHEGTAAWVQALGALAIIGATAWIAGRNAREVRDHKRVERDRLWESIVALSINCLDAMDRLLKNYPPSVSSDFMGHFLRAYAPSDFDLPMDGLAAVPLHQVGDAVLVENILRLRGVMGRLKRQLDYILHEPATSFDRTIVTGPRTDVYNAVVSIVRTVRGHADDQMLSALAFRDANVNVTSL